MGERGPELEPRPAVTPTDASGGEAAEAPAPAPQGRFPVVPAALSALWVMVATALQLVRAPDRRPWTAIWAEDGQVFLSEALDRPLATLFEPHSGYLQLAARAVGSLAASLPIDAAAATFAVAGSIGVALLSVYVYVSSASVLASWWARALMAFTFVLAPATAFEVATTGLNLHWYLLFASFWALWSTSTSTRAVVADSVVVAAATLSGPLTLLYAPLALRRGLVATGARRWVVPGVYAAAGACQLLAMVLSDSGGQRFQPFRLLDVPLGYGLRVAGSVVVGDGALPWAWRTFGWWFALASLVLVGSVCAYGISRSRGQKLAFMCTALAYSGLLFAVALYLRGSAEMHPVGDVFNLNGSRYTVVPVLLVIAVLLATADGPAPRSAGRSGARALALAWIPRGVAVLVAIVTLLSYGSVETVRVRAPDWGASLEAARAECDETGAEAVPIPVAPGPPDVWHVVFPCER